MKSIIASVVLFALLGVGSLFAQDKDDLKRSDNLFSLDAGAGISFGIMEKSGNEAEDTLGGFATFLATLRGAAHGTLRLNFTDNMSVGARLGFYAIQYSNEDGESSTLVDLPVHGLIRGKLGPISLEGFGGYYLSMVKSDDYNYGGFEVGAKLSLGWLYGSYSKVFADPVYDRIEIGFQLTDVFNF